ncbi:MAG: hypothetical protein ACYC9M_06185 [Desulfobulbaceae bacterium]
MQHIGACSPPRETLDRKVLRESRGFKEIKVLPVQPGHREHREQPDCKVPRVPLVPLVPPVQLGHKEPLAPKVLPAQ